MGHAMEYLQSLEIGPPLQANYGHQSYVLETNQCDSQWSIPEAWRFQAQSRAQPESQLLSWDSAHGREWVLLSPELQV